MDKTAIKNFAVWARVKLMGDIRTRLGLLGITGEKILEPSAASTSEIQYFDIGTGNLVSVKGAAISQRREIVRLLHDAAKETSYADAIQNFVEKMAYDWFNRLVAIRYMEVNEYEPLDIRLLSSVEEGRQDPDLVMNPFDSNLEFTQTEEQQITEWKAAHDNSKIFRLLLFKMCNELHAILPGIFEGKDDYSELLMRQSFIDRDGIIWHLVHDIPEEDWKDQVQIIGWIYQYYNSELKDDTFRLLKKNVKISKERIPSATQLFTPDWIVRYMVENSLGRLWIEHLRAIDPDTDEKKIADHFQWQYYIPEAKQDPKTEQQLCQIRVSYEDLKPEDLTCLDPCMGSGHILAYMFDVLMQIYRSVGYTDSGAVKSILKNNLYGLDIDDRAYQLAYFSVMMKARQYSYTVLTSEVCPHVYAIEESNSIDMDELENLGEEMSPDRRTQALQQARQLVILFHDAKIYGSILKVPEMDWDLLRELTMDEDNGWEKLNWNQEIQGKLNTLIDIGETLSRKYWVTATNPPYMGGSGMHPLLSKYVKDNYPDSSSDLFAVFIEACGKFINPDGFYSMITQHAWMFTYSFEKLRNNLLNHTTINMLHLGARAFDDISGEVVQTTTFIKTGHLIINYRTSYFRLVDFNGEENQKKRTISAIRDGNCNYYYESSIEKFNKIPGKPVAYWVSDQVSLCFANMTALGDLYKLLAGTSTGANYLYEKLWFEVSYNRIARNKNIESNRWYPLNTGGNYQRYTLYFPAVIDWENDGYRIRHHINSQGKIGSAVRNREYFFKPGITWNKLSSSKFGVRELPEGYISDDTARVISVDDERERKLLLGFLASKVCLSFLQILSPTLSFTNTELKRLPICYGNQSDEIVRLTSENCSCSKSDIDARELSWDFKTHPLVSAGQEKYSRISDAFKRWRSNCVERFETVKKNDERINAIFIDIYNLHQELTPDESDDTVTIQKADSKQDICSLISYIVGCIFGRYSLDEEGLIYAGGDWDISRYHKYIPDPDNVVPITDQRYLEDDVVDRICEFLTMVYGKETLEENLDFIAKALGSKGTTSRDIIRNYMLNDFFKDHCNTYSVTGSGKRPIYWLFDSGKQNAFKALVYMHRWDADTAGRVLLYAQRIQQKYETELRAIDTILEHLSNPKEQAREERRQDHLRRQLAELIDYEERLEHMANERISIDLDDGVKVNYEKVQTDRQGKKFQILAPIK